jgi:hypothetical protein
LDSQSLETDEYYSRALDPIFTELKIPAYITVGRWSYVLGANNKLLLFSPKSVGGMSEQQSEAIEREFSREDFKNALRKFSITKLLVESDRELWFHFTDKDAPGEGEEQTYLRNITVSPKKGTAEEVRIELLEVAAERVTGRLVHQIIEKLRPERKGTSPGQGGAGADADELLYEGRPLREKADAIQDTLDAAIFSLFQARGCGMRHSYFMPVPVGPRGNSVGLRRVVGIISINTEHPLLLGQLAPILQPFVQGIMAPFHFGEIDHHWKRFSLKSAIAAIMSRNMSHNIGSHVLWHLSQELQRAEAGHPPAQTY